MVRVPLVLQAMDPLWVACVPNAQLVNRLYLAEPALIVQRVLIRSREEFAKSAQLASVALREVRRVSHVALVRYRCRGASVLIAVPLGKRGRTFLRNV